MDQPHIITPIKEIDNNNDSIPPLLNISMSSIFMNYNCSKFYLEIFNKSKDIINLVFRRPEIIISKKEIKEEKINEFKEIKLIFDFQCLSYELILEDVKKLIYQFYNEIKDKNNKKLSLSIENSLIKNFSTLVLENNKLKLNELIISDELYNISPNLNIIFPEIEVNKLTLKKFKINSRLQLSNFCKFIIDVECKELILEDIFIELIIKKDENDIEYNDLDSYFTYQDGVITLNNQYTYIRSLILKDCPLFALSENMFTLNKELNPKTIIIDENSLINPSIITKFKIIEKKFYICFDLDSYKMKKEQEEENNEKEIKEEDYLDYLTYIFNIIIGFQEDNNIKDKINEEEEEESEEDDDKIGKIDRGCLYKLTFKNFDTTKYEYITNESLTLISEENWILNDEEKSRKKKWENFEEKLNNFKFEKLSSVKELSFDNCTNFFIQWVLKFIKGNEDKIIKKSYENDFEVLKFKKCGKDYIDLKNILTMKINNLILFDTPLIIDHFNDEQKPHLDYLNNNLGTIQNLTIKINTLDYYKKEYNLNIYKTMEIIVELIQCNKFNKNLIFDMNSLTMIMTFLVYKNYYPKRHIYDNLEIEEKGEYLMTEKEIEEINQKNKKNNIDKEELTYVPKQIFFCCKKYRDFLINNSLKLESLEGANITIANATIKKQSENYEHQNYLSFISKKQDNQFFKNNEIKKVDFGYNLINIDKDFKLFFSINNINEIKLINVSFSHFINNSLKKEEGITIINTLNFSEDEEKSINENKYPKPHIPNYKMDMKTLNGILFKNYLYEDIGSLFRYFMMKIKQIDNQEEKDVSSEDADKKIILMEYFKNYKMIFDCFSKNINKLIIIVNKIQELKELYCIFSIIKIIDNEKNWIKEKLIVKKIKKEIELPNKKIIENEIGDYFLRDKNEEENEVYSEFNYYYSSPGEENMFRNKYIVINNYKYYIECQFDDYI